MYFLGRKNTSQSIAESSLPSLSDFDAAKLPTLGRRTPRSPRMIAAEAEEAMDRIQTAIVNGHYRGRELLAARYYLEQQRQTLEYTDLLTKQPSFFYSQEKLIRQLLLGSELAIDVDLRYALGARARHLLSQAV
jgi:hypothetical protein